jgi:glycosyltransferase involved in cell wall biosynthesis
MRILLAVHQFMPEFRAGTESLTLRTGQELQRRGHTLWILTGSHSTTSEPELDTYEQDGLRVIRLRAPDPPSPLQGGLGQSYRRDGLRPKLASVLDRVRPDLVHLFHLRRLTLTLAELLEERGLPVVASLTDYWFACLTGQLQFPEATPCPGPDPGSVNCLRHAAAKTFAPFERLPLPFWSSVSRALGRWGRGGLATSLRQLQERPQIMHLALARFDRILVPSQRMADTFARLGFAMGGLRVCPYGLDCTGLSEQPPRKPWPGSQERPLRVSFIGTFSPAKGVHVLLEALRLLGPDQPLEVQLYGSPDEHPVYGGRVAQEVSRWPRSKLALMGLFPPDRIFTVLSETDLLVIPSLWRENSPLILLQALASGLPILASDVEGMADQLQPGRNSALFAPGDAQELAAWLGRFLADPSLLAKLCNQGGDPRTVSDYVDQLEREYRFSLNNSSRRPLQPPRP